MVKELMASTGVFNDEAKVETVQNFMKSTQKLGHSEGLFLALQTLIRGKKLDIKNICEIANFKGRRNGRNNA